MVVFLYIADGKERTQCFEPKRMGCLLVVDLI